MKELSPLEKQAKEAMIDILQDVVLDYKKNVKRLQAIIVLLVVLLVGTFVYYEWSFKSFLSQYDYSNEIIENNIEADTEGNGTIYDLNNHTIIGK